MKKIKYSLYFLSLVGALGITSCDDNDVDQDYPLSTDKPVVSITAESMTLVENDQPATFTVTADKAHFTTMKFKMELIPSETTASPDDYTISLGESPIDFGSPGLLITLPANSTSTTFTVTPVLDYEIEGPETLAFNVYPVADLNGVVAEESRKIVITINNGVSGELISIFDWNSDQEYLGVDNAFHPLSLVDFDLEVYDAGFNVVLSSYTSAPEEIGIPNDAPDGTYYIAPSLWTIAGTVAPAAPLAFETKLTLIKPGAFVHEIVLNDIWSYEVGGNEEGNPNAYYVAARVEKTTVDGVSMYEIFDPSDNLLVSGRMADLNAALKGNRASKRAK